MSTIRIPTSFNIDLEFEIPELYRRFLALLIDYGVLTMGGVALYFCLAGTLNRSKFNDIDSWALFLIFTIPFMLYWLVIEIWTKGQSVGKMVMRIRVINMTGGKPSLSQYFIRWLLRLIDFGVTLGAGAFFSVVFSKYGQRLGDLAAGTILVSTNPKVGLDETIFMEMASSYVPRFPQVMQLTDRDLNTIRSLLQRARNDDNFGIAATAAEKVKSVLKIDTPMEPFDFLETLLMDYNYISVQ